MVQKTIRSSVEEHSLLRYGLVIAAHQPWQGSRYVRLLRKQKAPVKANVVGRRSAEEAQFLDDLVTFVVFSRVKPTDELFCRYLARKNSNKLDRKTLWGKMVRNAVKRICKDAGLPPNYFSSHSLRKGATTQMRAMGVS